jgi:hypothetical protein
MKFVLIDYSGRYYRESKGTRVPPERRGKFVQIRDMETEYIVLAPRKLSYYHANIVERFFLSRGMAGGYNPKGDFYSVNHPDWTVVGGGMWDINEDERTLRLYGTSQAYGGFDAGGLEERILSLKDMEGYRVRVMSGSRRR